MLLLLACASLDDGGAPDDTDTAAPLGVLDHLYGSVTRPADADIGGIVEIEHWADLYADEPHFNAGAGFWDGSVRMTQPWDDPFEGLGDCGYYTAEPSWESDTTSLSAGTVFLDAGLGEPFPLYVTGVDQGSFRDAGWGPPPWGAVFAVTAVGDDLPAFDWDPAMALPDEPLLLTEPPQPQVGSEVTVPYGPVDLAWEGAAPYARVAIDISANSAQQGAYCEVPDTGAFTLPGELLDALQYRIHVTVTRERVRYEEVFPGRFVELRTTSRDKLVFVRE